MYMIPNYWRSRGVGGELNCRWRVSRTTEIREELKTLRAMMTSLLMGGIIASYLAREKIRAT